MITQRLVNKYPSWTKIRMDPSSFGQRLYSPIGEYFDFAYTELKQDYNSFELKKLGLGLDSLYKINLEYDDYILSTATPGGGLEWNYPVVSCSNDSISVIATRVDSLEQLYWTVPNRVSTATEAGLDSFQFATVPATGLPTILDIPIESKIKFTFDNSDDNWYKKLSTRNPLQSGIHRIIINGFDQHGIEIEESLDVVDTVPIWTRNVFSVVENIRTTGFSTTIYGSVLNSKSVLEDPFRIGISDEGLEGPLFLETSSASGKSFISFYTPYIKIGEEYRDGINEIPYNKEILWELELVDSTSTSYTIVDSTFNPNTSRLYVLDTNSVLHIYEYDFKKFTVPYLDSSITKASYIDIYATQNWCKIDEEVTFSTRFSRARFPIVSVEIKRLSPSHTVEYLQVDKTWGGAAYVFPGDPNVQGLVEASIQDIYFSSTLDEYGIWEFYVTTKTQFDTTVSQTSVLVDRLTALVDLQLDGTNPYSCNFDHTNRLAIVFDEPGPNGENYKVITYNEHSDVYLADEENQVLYLRENYTSLDIN